MNRRTFIGAIAVSLLAAPLVAGAQPGEKVRRIGAFHVGLDHIPPSLDTLREGLKVLGYEEGRNLRLDWRNLPDEDAAFATARDFTRDRVDLIVAFENQTARAAKAATAQIPVVFLHVTDPVAEGLVKTLARPGGNLTGFVYYAVSPAKRLELFKEIVPRLRRVLVLVDPHDPVAPGDLAEVQQAADRLVSRTGRDHARRSPELAQAIAVLPVPTLILDGEVCRFDEKLVSRFHRLSEPDGLALATPPVFMAFDCLHLHGRDLRPQPLADRRRARDPAGVPSHPSSSAVTSGDETAASGRRVLHGGHVV